jgi:putative hemolysin
MGDNLLPEDVKYAFIDVDKVFATKNPKLYKLLPRFIFSYLKRIIHQKELNEVISTNRNLYGLDFLDAILKQFGVKIIFSGIENIPQDGRYVVAANHPLGGLDGMSLMWVMGKVNKNIVFPVNDLLMNLSNLKELFIPINKHGSNARNIKLLDDTFASDKAMLFFPAGLCSRWQNGQIIDLEWKKSFITKARNHARDIIPWYIEGRNSSWFYGLARLRDKLKIKANIEMLYLVDEMYKQRNKEIRISFGKPISYTTFDKTIKDNVWAQRLKEHVYKLKENSSLPFETV